VTLQPEPGGAPRCELVKVLQLAIKTYPALRLAMADEMKLAALYCQVQGPKSKVQGQQPEWIPATVEWAEQLEPESHERVITEGERINSAFFGRWVERQKARESLLPKSNPEETAAIVEAVARANPQLFEVVMSKQPTGSRRLDCRDLRRNRAEAGGCD